MSWFRVEETGRIRADFRKNSVWPKWRPPSVATFRPATRRPRFRRLVEVLMARSIAALQKRTGLRNLAVGGGVYANVRLNRHLLENTAADAIFIFPAMGDEGLPIGGCLDYLLQQRGPEEWQRNRRVLDSMLLGRDHRAEPDALAAAFPKLRLSPIREPDAVVAAVADALVAGKAVGIHDGRMEFGPRALGARSILASPTRREINDSLNARLSRSDFMPFAPVVLSEYAEQLFDIRAGNAHAAHFMTITCDVRAAWRDRIPGRRPHRRIGEAANRRSRAANALSPHSGSLVFPQRHSRARQHQLQRPRRADHRHAGAGADRAGGRSSGFAGAERTDFRALKVRGRYSDR